MGDPAPEGLGFSYDSFVFASIAHDRHGKLQGLPIDEAVIEIAPGFHEVPASSLIVASRPVPWGGGGYFRAIPYSVYRWGIGRILRSGRPYVFYIHPWEIDPGQPRIGGLPRTYAVRHYLGLHRAERRLTSLLADFRWTTISRLLAGPSGE